MPIFLERFVLPVLAALVVALCALNPWRWVWHQRLSLLLGMVFLAYFFAYTSYHSNPQKARTAPMADAHKSGDAKTNGPQSPAVTGDGNDIKYDNSSRPEKSAKPTPK